MPYHKLWSYLMIFLINQLPLGNQLVVRLAPAQSVLKEEERKETAREALAEAVSDPDVATLPDRVTAGTAGCAELLGSTLQLDGMLPTTGMMAWARMSIVSILMYIVYIHTYIYILTYIYGKCLGFARTRNDDRRRIIIIIVIRTRLLLNIFNECRSLTGVG